MIEHGDGLAWLHRGLEGCYLTFAEGIPAEELAVRLGAPADSPVLDADTVAAIERAAPPWEQPVPDIGRIGDAGNGWSFVLLPCTAYWEHGRTGPESPYGRCPSHGIRTVSAVYTGMDPAQIDVMHDGQHLWGYSDSGFDGSRPHLLNTALADLGWNADEEEEEDEYGEVPPHSPSYELLYAALGNFFGLNGLPRAAIENRTLPGMFCEPRELPRHEYADAPAGPYGPCEQCGGPMVLSHVAKAVGSYVLYCDRCKALGGYRVEGLTRTEERTVPNPKWANVNLLGDADGDGNAD
ncbi:hypothetical protein [Streptomyces sp. NBC_00439]|uniref:hypothetical protein n=2 Tax=unclassified Streptomyces TaxID=2593676 RepID=UPI00224ED94B|nr:hypothetical protein [Streptomyces sp. NBC_00439]MCX5101330.1 hypothetical protein [Streptomyces sp. NBC_00439]